MKTIAIVQARLASVRFPNKVLRPIGGTPMIGLLIKRLASATRLDGIMLATTSAASDDVLADYVRGLGYPVFRGDVVDVLDRYYQAARSAGATTVVRVTGDCPLIDGQLVDSALEQLVAGVDYVGNKDPATYPDGLDTEAFPFTALETAWREATKPYDREHVTPYLRANEKMRRVNFTAAADYSAERWTVDEPEDLEVVARVVAHFHPRYDFAWEEVLALRQSRPEIFAGNQHLIRDEGAKLGTGQKLWKRAKRIIPGGNMLLSKRAEMHLPDQWPAYFKRTRGCKVWDLDDREYLDVSFMGIGTNVLGYSHPEVDDAVRGVVDTGNLCTLNAPEEVYLAERLVRMHPWADMVRFARSGGEANSICIRIARAAAGRDKVAFCGYHGWHDWYLAANLGNEKNLAGHLLPGLEPKGVPQYLRGSVLPFTYNRMDELDRLVHEHDIGVIKMEVMRNIPPQDNFLRRVRELATAKGIVLVFDECTSGFRESIGGLHKVYGVEPDMATFGKTLGNGYAVTAIIGRREIMTHAESTFISSTFWTERIGSVAALKTLEVMERLRSWETITRIGRSVGERWQALGRKHGLPLRVFGLPAMINFTIESPRMLAYKTFITQEMLRQGFLATASFYACIDHNEEVLGRYFEALDPLFGIIAECEAGREIEPLLHGPIAHAGFRRLN